MAAAPGGMKGFYTFLGAALVLGVGVLGFLFMRKPSVSIPANPVIQVGDTSGFRGYLLGSDSAPLEVTEYADFQCPACQQWATVQFPTIEERLIRTGRVRWRYRDFPLDMHPFARIAAHVAACASEQGKYWDMNQKIYSWEGDWPEKSNPIGVFNDYANNVGLDRTKYDACMNSGRYAGRMRASYLEGVAAGVGSTPTFLINGRLYPGGNAVHYDMLKALLDSLAGQKPAQ
jgi:protein-disulfide isomerase